MSYVYCKPKKEKIRKATCGLKHSRGTNPECEGCPGGEPCEAPYTLPPVCSKCLVKSVNKNTQKREWAGGKGLCLGCYEVCRREGLLVAKVSRKAAPQTRPSTAPELPPVKAVEDGYDLLRAALEGAYRQAADGKGKDRHARGRPFTEQPIITIPELLPLH